MKKLKSALIERAIQVEELPVLVPRPLAAKFGCVSSRTLKLRHRSRVERLAAMPKVKEGRPLEVGPLGPDCFVIA
jgi:hypothetical protein